jgi:hypothetical protein
VNSKYGAAKEAAESQPTSTHRVNYLRRDVKIGKIYMQTKFKKQKNILLKDRNLKDLLIGTKKHTSTSHETILLNMYIRRKKNWLAVIILKKKKLAESVVFGFGDKVFVHKKRFWLAVIILEKKKLAEPVV